MPEYQSHSSNNNLPFPGKVAVVTSAAISNQDDFDSAGRLIAKYSAEKIVHATWPEEFTTEYKQLTDTVATLAEDREIKALVINRAYHGSNAAVDKLRETRDDIFIVYCATHEPPVEAVSHADLLLSTDETRIGPAMVEQAKKQGAKTFVHYSFPRHMSLLDIASRHDSIRKTCANEGLQFIDATALDPTEEAGVAIARQFILEDVPKLTAKYGENTAFFCTNCNLQPQLIKAVVDCHAIYPQPCCPSLYHGFPEALGIEIGEGKADLSYLINEACSIAAEKNMTDRLSTWPVSTSSMFTNAGAEYAIKWIKDEVTKTGIDNKALLNCMNSYITEVVGEESNVFMNSYSENGITYDNFKLILMSYLDL
jgi:hypothetical protein